MRAKEFISEAAYPGNLGMMELMQFYKIASPEIKKTLKSLLAAGKKEEALQLLQKVTKTKLIIQK